MVSVPFAIAAIPTERSEVLAITCNLLEALEKSSVHAATAFGSHWLKNWLDTFKPITA